MIPNVCANCEVGGNVGNDDRLFGHVCDALPFTLWIDNPLEHRCGWFKMLDNPVYILPDRQPASEEAPDAQDPADGAGTEE